MENKFKLHSKHSFSPARPKENIFKLRAKIGKKTVEFPQIEIRERIINNNRTVSHSPHKIRYSSSKLFGKAKKLQAAQTYLFNEKVYMLNKTNASESPESIQKKRLTIVKPTPRVKNLRSFSLSKDEVSFKSPDHKSRQAIQKTLSIIIDGKNQQMKSGKELMTTLSKLILQGDQGDDDLYIQFMDESSIHGDEQNYIDIDSKMLQGESTATETPQLVQG